MVMQAIVVKYHGPTNTRPSCLRVRAAAGRLRVSWEHALNPDENYAAAARAFVRKLGWGGTWVGGGLPDGSHAFVCVSRCDVMASLPGVLAFYEPEES